MCSPYGSCWRIAVCKQSSALPSILWQNWRTSCNLSTCGLGQLKGRDSTWLVGGAVDATIVIACPLIFHYLPAIARTTFIELLTFYTHTCWHYCRYWYVWVRSSRLWPTCWLRLYGYINFAQANLVPVFTLNSSFFEFQDLGVIRAAVIQATSDWGGDVWKSEMIRSDDIYCISQCIVIIMIYI